MAGRATTTRQLAEIMSRFITEQGMARALAFSPRPSDVIIATYPKAGTTWMQQIVHGLRTGGDMDFDEITGVTPWIETAHDLGLDLDGEQKAHPRAFKSHWSGDQVPVGCRYICVIRDPRDTIVSFANFFDGWLVEPGTVTADQYAEFMAGGKFPFGDYWSHLKTWWARRHEPRVLMLAYEDMLRDLPGQVRRVANFIGLGGNHRAIAIATRQAGYDFMKAHESQFDDHLVPQARNRACGVPEDAYSSKVKSGKAGGHRGVLSDRKLAQLDEAWAREIEAPLGHASYDDLRRALADGG